MAAAMGSAHGLATELLNTLPEPIFVKDAQHRWIIINDAFCAFVGRAREDLLVTKREFEADFPQ